MTSPTSLLDSFFPRDPAAVVTLAEAVTTAADITGPGGLFADLPAEPTGRLVDRVADMICALGEWPPVAENGEKLRKDLRSAARWVLSDVRGDLDKIERAYKAMINDNFQVKVCHSASSPWTVARRMYAVAAKLPMRDDENSRYLKYIQEETPAEIRRDEAKRKQYLDYLAPPPRRAGNLGES